MPVPVNTQLAALSAMLPAMIAAYNTPNSRTANYNITYENFIVGRTQGIATHGCLANWIKNGSAAAEIHNLLTAFGMSAQRSILVALPVLHGVLNGLPAGILNWIQNISLPLPTSPCTIINSSTHSTLSVELQDLFNVLAAPGSVTLSGGFVAASKTLHCLFPDLAPMIDGRHSGLSYFHISRATYLPPLGLRTWDQWNGTLLLGIPNPSPRGAGRANWDSARFVAAIGINQHIYEIWRSNNHNPNLRDFLALDSARGTTGIPRIVDKLLW